MACVCDGRPFTEIDALEALFDVSAIHYASGGWGGAEGCVTLIVDGPDAEVGKVHGIHRREDQGRAGPARRQADPARPAP